MRLLGEVNDETKQGFLAGAAALLFPIDWPEPFGLVMIEAMACGTPVIAFRSGSVPEVIDDGVTGFVVDSEAEAVQAIARIDELDRREVRARFEQRFTAERMAKDYCCHYETLVRASSRSFVPPGVLTHPLRQRKVPQVAEQIVTAPRPEPRIAQGVNASPGRTDQVPLPEP
jgi:glycogen synthase